MSRPKGTKNKNKEGMYILRLTPEQAVFLRAMLWGYAEAKKGKPVEETTAFFLKLFMKKRRKNKQKKQNKQEMKKK